MLPPNALPPPSFFFFFQAEDGIRDYKVTGVQTCALPIYLAFMGQVHPAGGVHMVHFAGKDGGVGIDAAVYTVWLHQVVPFIGGGFPGRNGGNMNYFHRFLAIRLNLKIAASVHVVSVSVGTAAGARAPSSSKRRPTAMTGSGEIGRAPGRE